MEIQSLGRLLILFGVVLLIVGVIVLVAGKVPFLGRWPEDLAQSSPTIQIVARFILDSLCSHEYA